MRAKTIIRYVICFACAGGAALCGRMIYREWMPRQQADALYEEVRQMAFAGVADGDTDETAGNTVEPPQPVSDTTDSGEMMPGRVRTGPPDFAALTAWNPDIAGWLWSPGTDIDYPIVQGPDNEYYLNRTADGKASIIGSVFMESGNSREFTDDVTVLYGHHIRNGKMFSSLSGYKSQSYYESHPELFLYTPQGNYRVVLFAGQILNGKSDAFPLVFGANASRMKWVESVISTSTFQSGIRPQAGMRMVALCTCTYEYDDARYAVYGILEDLGDE